MQQAMCAHPELVPVPPSAPVPRIQTPMLTYVALLQSLGAMPGVSLQPMHRRQGGPDLYDSEDAEDGRLLAAQQPTVGQPNFALEISLLLSRCWWSHLSLVLMTGSATKTPLSQQSSEPRDSRRWCNAVRLGGSPLGRISGSYNPFLTTPKKTI